MWPAGYTYPDPAAVPLVFVPVPEPKAGKNRVHLDLASRSAAHQAELVSRARDLGGTPADIGQGDVPWAVLADPEGNEFCVLEPRDIYRDTGPVAAILTDCADPAAPGPVLGGRRGLADQAHRGRHRRAAVACGNRALPGVPPGPGPEAGQEPAPSRRGPVPGWRSGGRGGPAASRGRGPRRRGPGRRGVLDGPGRPRRQRVLRAVPALAGQDQAETRSQTKMRVSPGAIELPAPRSP